MRKSLLISAALLLPTLTAVYAAFPHAPAAPQATPVAAAAPVLRPAVPPAVADPKWDERFPNYVLENTSSGGL